MSSVDVSAAGDTFSLPVLRCGKVLVLLQPDRGSAGDRSRAITTRAARRAALDYVAVYAWLRERRSTPWSISARTARWNGCPARRWRCRPSAGRSGVLGPLPVIYPFIVNNPGEAVQAKRRLGAITIGHLTPPLSAAGLHGPLAELEGMIEEYAAADGLDRRRLALSSKRRSSSAPGPTGWRPTAAW